VSAEQDAMRLAMMGITEMAEPWHEWVLGEVAYFVRQGFTYEQARAMAAAEFVSIAGARIELGATRPEEPE
jgi:formylglycine-generating enzyme required for sulfatase activity